MQPSLEVLQQLRQALLGSSVSPEAFPQYLPTLLPLAKAPEAAVRIWLQELTTQLCLRRPDVPLQPTLVTAMIAALHDPEDTALAAALSALSALYPRALNDVIILRSGSKGVWDAIRSIHTYIAQQISRPAVATYVVRYLGVVASSLASIPARLPKGVSSSTLHPVLDIPALLAEGERTTSAISTLTSNPLPFIALAAASTLAMTLRHCPPLLPEYLPILVQLGRPSAPDHTAPVADARGISRATRTHLLSLYDGLQEEPAHSLLYAALNDVGMSKEREKRDSRARKAKRAEPSPPPPPPPPRGSRPSVSMDEDIVEDALEDGSIPSYEALSRASLRPAPVPVLLAAPLLRNALPIQAAIELLLSSLIRVSPADLRSAVAHSLGGPGGLPEPIVWGRRDPRQSDPRFENVPILTQPASSLPLPPLPEVSIPSSMPPPPPLLSMTQDQEDEEMESIPTTPVDHAVVDDDASTALTKPSSDIPPTVLFAMTLDRLLDTSSSPSSSSMSSSTSSPGWAPMIARIVSSLPSREGEPQRARLLAWVLEDVHPRFPVALAWIQAEFTKAEIPLLPYEGASEDPKDIDMKDEPEDGGMEGEAKDSIVNGETMDLDMTEEAKESKEDIASKDTQVEGMAGNEGVDGIQDAEVTPSDYTLWSRRLLTSTADGLFRHGPESPYSPAWITLIRTIPQVDEELLLSILRALLGHPSASPLYSPPEDTLEGSVDATFAIGLRSIEVLLSSTSSIPFRLSLLSLLLCTAGDEFSEDLPEALQDTADDVETGDKRSLAALAAVVRAFKRWSAPPSTLLTFTDHIREFSLASIRAMGSASLLQESAADPADHPDQEDTIQEDAPATVDADAVKTNSADTKTEPGTTSTPTPSLILSASRVKRRIWLFSSLAMEDPTMLPAYFDAYVTADDGIRRIMRAEARPLILSTLHRPSGLATDDGLEGVDTTSEQATAATTVDPAMISLLAHFPQEAESLVLRTLVILTEKGAPPPAVVSAVLDAYTRRSLDARFILPILAGMPKPDVVKHLPKVISMLDGSEQQRAVVRATLLRLVSSASTSPPSEDHLTPSDLFTLLHHLNPASLSGGIKQQVEATDICLMDSATFDPEIIGASLQHMSQEAAGPNAPPLPTLFMRTLIQALNLHPWLIQWGMSLLYDLSTPARAVWAMSKVTWQGWVRCVKSRLPHSIHLLANLPRNVRREALAMEASLQEPWDMYVMASGFVDREQNEGAAQAESH